MQTSVKVGKRGWAGGKAERLGFGQTRSGTRGFDEVCEWMRVCGLAGYGLPYTAVHFLRWTVYSGDARAVRYLLNTAALAGDNRYWDLGSATLVRWGLLEVSGCPARGRTVQVLREFMA